MAGDTPLILSELAARLVPHVERAAVAAVHEYMKWHLESRSRAPTFSRRGEQLFYHAWCIALPIWGWAEYAVIPDLRPGMSAATSAGTTHTLDFGLVFCTTDAGMPFTQHMPLAPFPRVAISITWEGREASLAHRDASFADDGWRVIRVDESEILTDPVACVMRIAKPLASEAEGLLYTVAGHSVTEDRGLGGDAISALLRRQDRIR